MEGGDETGQEVFLGEGGGCGVCGGGWGWGSCRGGWVGEGEGKRDKMKNSLLCQIEP